MSKRRISKILAGAVALALASATVQADQGTKKGATKEQKVGMASGTVVGAILGGPIGAAVGFMAGTLTGTGVGEFKDAKKSAKSLQEQLTSAQQELAQLAASKANDKAASDAKIDMLYEQFAQRLHADVFFRTASADLDPSASEKLADLGKILGAYSDLSIDIDGFADPRGKSVSNDELSEQRAMAVRAALIVGGAAPERIHVVAHGDKLSTAAKDDLEAYSWERRVSLSVRSANSSQVAQTK
jgi:outer membrane protein OmpA-like peptidoglycan-associated protein